MQTWKMAVVRFEYRKKYPFILTTGITSLHNFTYIGFQQSGYSYTVIGHIIYNNLGREYYEFR